MMSWKGHLSPGPCTLVCLTPLAVLPPEHQTGPECWRCGQLGHWHRECPLMEVGQVVQVVGLPTSAHGSEGVYRIPVRLQGSEHLPLLDSGAMQTLIQHSLV